MWRVNVTGKDNTLIAKGVRNGFGLAIGPGGTVFTAVNQMDNQPYPFKDGTGNYGKVITSYVNENPVDQVTRLTRGSTLAGRTACPTPARPRPPEHAVRQRPRVQPHGQEDQLRKLPKTMLGLPAHSAPLGLNFTTGTKFETVIGNGAIITTHGSWNRTPPRAPVVLFSPWNGVTKSLGATVPLVSGFQNSDGSRWGRCVDAVVGPDGSLYVTDDAAGLVYRITPPS